MFENLDLQKLVFGRLTLDALPLHEPILVVTFIVVALGGIAVFGAITYFRLWSYLWHEWFTSIDHKKIGVMYVVLALIMLLRGFSDAIMMRGQQAIAFGANEGYLPPHHYDQIFTAHGVIMIFFMAMPFVTGLMNFVVPLQIGARDVAFPFLNNFSFWMTVGGAVIVMISLFVGEFAQTGWLAYPPLSGIAYSPNVGVDYYIWSLQIAGVGTTLSGINLIVTILKMRAQQAIAFNGNEGYLPANHFDQIFTAHGVIMIFFVAMPLVTGLMNFVVPLQRSEEHTSELQSQR